MAQQPSANLNQATHWIKTCVASGAPISFGKRHADDEMRKDRLSRADVLSALKRGRVTEAQGGSARGIAWRYKVQGPALDESAIVVIVEIEIQPDKFTVVTVWRIQRV